jgi:hypothetical protein
MKTTLGMILNSSDEEMILMAPKRVPTSAITKNNVNGVPLGDGWAGARLNLTCQLPSSHHTGPERTPDTGLGSPLSTYWRVTKPRCQMSQKWNIEGLTTRAVDAAIAESCNL